MTHTVEAIWIKRAPGEPLAQVASVRAVTGAGLEGNLHQGGQRQVTLISTRAWDAVQQELAVPLDPAVRRANILVSGIDFADSRGRTLRLGSTSIVIRGETMPCHLMEQACPGLRAVLQPDWRGGVYGEVLEDGEVRVGDAVRWG